MVVREPEWTARERSLILAHLANESDVGPFGIPLSRAVSSDAMFTASALPKRNKAVKAVLDAQERYFTQYPQADRGDSSLMWSVWEASDLPDDA